jgi:hypothetical protein
MLLGQPIGYAIALLWGSLIRIDPKQADALMRDNGLEDRPAAITLFNRSPIIFARERRSCFHCFCGFASRKSFTIGTMTGMRNISVTCVVFGNMANLDSERGPMSP